MIQGLTPSQRFLLVLLPYTGLVLGGLFLWIGLLFLGVIARRYEKALGKSTEWQFMMIAPTGLLVFTLINFYAVLIKGMIKPPPSLTWWAYLFFSLSCGLSLVSILRFFRIIRRKR